MNYYEILEIDLNSTQEEIKKAYHRLAKKYHPDLNPDKDTTNKMQRINEAYEVLSDLEKRKKYDLTLKDKKQEVKIDNETAYQSYTKCKEESEKDFDPWLKNYLNSRRRLTKLYQEYTKLEGNIIALREGYVKPYATDVVESKLLQNEIIREIVFLSNRNGDNPKSILQFLISEIEPIYNRCVAYKKDYLKVPPSDIILQDLLILELVNMLKKYTNSNNEYYQDSLKYILAKYLEVCQKITDYGWRDESYSFNNFLKELFQNVISNNKEAIEKIIDGTTRK